MTADLDRLDLELRSVPGVVAVGLEGVDGGQLVVQVVALAASPRTTCASGCARPSRSAPNRSASSSSSRPRQRARADPAC